MAPTYCYGYKPDSHGVLGMGTRLTRSQLEVQTTVANAHPEVWRRVITMMEAAAKAGVPLGPGTGWRIQPNPPPSGFAQPGNSWHESCPVNPVSRTALAFDMVPEPSWDWMEANVARFGLRTFRNVNDESWHIQPVEIPAGRSFATTLPPLPRFNLPGPPPLPTVPRPVLRRGDEGLAVRRLINQLKFFKWYPARFRKDKNNGEFGLRCGRGVRNMQRALKVPVTGVYDRRTARALRNFLIAVSKL